MADPELTSWCEQHGVIINGIKAGLVSEGWRGIMATKDLSPDEVILRVPERLLLSSRSAQRDAQLTAALRRHQSLTPHQLLATHLLHEVSKGPDSFWWPYLRQIPRSYSSLANFAPEDVAALQVQHARDVALASVERSREDWRQVLPFLQELGLPKRFTAFRAWLWAASTLHSRTMYLPWCEAGALTPYGDLHNYQPPPAPYTPQLGGAVGRLASLDVALGRRRQCADASEGAREACRAGPGSLFPNVNTPVLGAVTPAYGWPLPRQQQPQPPQQKPRERPCGGSPGDGGSPWRAMIRNDDPGVSAGGIGTVEGSAVCEGSGRDSASTADGDGVVSAEGRAEGGAAAGREATSCEVELDGARACEGGNGNIPVDDAQKNDGVGGCQVNGDREEGKEEDEDEKAGATIAGDGMWDEAAQQYCIIVRRAYRRGEQVRLCYGRYTNLELLEHYGFVLQDNPHDIALVDFEPLLALLPCTARHSSGLPSLTLADCFLHANGQPSWQLLHLLRFCAATPQERRSQRHVLAAGEPVSEQGDRQVLQWLHAACTRQLGALGTSLEQDLALQRRLQQPSGSPGGKGSGGARLGDGNGDRDGDADGNGGMDGDSWLKEEERAVRQGLQALSCRGLAQQQQQQQPLIACAEAGIEGLQAQLQAGSGLVGPREGPSMPLGAGGVGRVGHVASCMGNPTAVSSAAEAAATADGLGEREQRGKKAGCGGSATAGGRSAAEPLGPSVGGNRDTEAVGDSETSCGEDAPAAAAGAGPGAAVVTEALSDGLTCAGLALDWRILQKRILLRAVRCAEAVLGREVFEGPGAAPRGLSALIRLQRQRPGAAA